MTRPHDTEVVLGRVLTIGTRLSTALLVLGVVGTLTSAAGAHALLSAGLVVLIGTPIARVAVSVIEFARSREWWFVLCTAFVLALLLGSLIVALRG
jgi:uncharacterized membrane protein